MSVLIKQTKKVRYHPGYSSMGTQNKKDYRIGMLLLFFAAFAVIITFRLFQLQIMDHEYYTALASGQHEIFQQLYPSRGNIYVQEKQGALV